MKKRLQKSLIFHIWNSKGVFLEHSLWIVEWKKIAKIIDFSYLERSLWISEMENRYFLNNFFILKFKGSVPGTLPLNCRMKTSGNRHRTIYAKSILWYFKRQTFAQIALNKIRENAEEEDRHVLKLPFIGSERTYERKIDMCSNGPLQDQREHRRRR